MSDKNDKKKTERRDFLFTATAAAGAVGVGAANLASSRPNEPGCISKSSCKYRG